VLLQVKLFDLPLQIFEMIPEFIESFEESLTSFVNHVDPSVQIGQKSFQMFKLRQTLFVLVNKPFGS
jgi:hypothetical protein